VGSCHWKNRCDWRDKLCWFFDDEHQPGTTTKTRITYILKKCLGLGAQVSPLDHEEEIPVFRVFQVLDPQSKLVNVFGRSNVILEGVRLAAELHT
jgi:hypothetical protein